MKIAASCSASPDMHPRHPFNPADYRRFSAETLAGVLEVGKKLTAQIAALETSVEGVHRANLRRLRYFAEHFALYYAVYAAQSQAEREAAFQRLCDYVDAQADASIGVCMTSAFLRWRLRPLLQG